MKKKLYYLFFASIFTLNVHAQVTIGSLDVPQEGAVLELKSDTLGFLPPRLNLVSLNKPDPLRVHVEGMIVFNKTVKTDEKLQIGFYYNTGSQWRRLYSTPSFTENWFYMPSIAFDTSNPSNEEITIDLYDEFKNQLNSSNNVTASDEAPVMALSTIPAATDLYYYVTAHDPEVFEIISISNDGKMKYKIKASASDETFLNIVFVEK